MKWTWDPTAYPPVADVLSEPTTDLGWCGRLEDAPADTLFGKVLCVCAASAVAREALKARSILTAVAAEALVLLDDWIDDPTDERFDRICGLIFPPDRSPDFDPYGLVWWALRTATSTVGFSEAGWALGSTCGGAIAAGLTPDQLRVIAGRAVRARQINPSKTVPPSGTIPTSLEPRL